MRAGLPVEPVPGPPLQRRGGAYERSVPSYLPPYLIGQRARIFYPCSTGFESRRGLANSIRLPAWGVNELSPSSALRPVFLRPNFPKY